MAGTIIREGKTITKGQITVECWNGYYRWQKDQNQPKEASYSYVKTKTMRLAAWLREQGVYWDNPLDTWHGQVQGYKYYLDTLDRVGEVCLLLKIECYAMAHPDLMGLEGCLIEIEGAIKEVKLYGEYIKFHSLRAEGQRFGNRIDRDDTLYFKIV